MVICFIADINTVHTQRIAKHFAQEGNQVHVLSINQANSLVSKNELGFKTHFVGPFWAGSHLSPNFIWNQVKIINKIRKMVKIIKPDILHSLFINDCGFYGALSGFHPFVVFAMGSDIFIYPNRNWVYRSIYKYVLRHADIIHCESVFAKELLCRDGADPNRVKAFPLGVNLNLFKPELPDPWYLKSIDLKPEDKIVISTRSLNSVYSVDTLIKAIPNVTSKFPEARLIIIGTGQLEESLKELAKQLKVWDVVRFLGFIPNGNIPKYINLSDIYVSTCLSDTFSISTLEAMACSKPVVVTNIPGTDEWIKDDWNGYLFPKQDYNVLADKIKHLFENPEVAKEMGLRNRKLVETKANVEESMEEIHKTYLQLKRQ